jgi:predicted anti-sigma-YlaC factor YlaD
VRTDCEQARARLSLRLDDELSAHEAVLLDRHLDGCPACAAFASDVHESTELLRATPLEAAPQVWLVRRPSATRLAARVAAVTAAAAAAVLMAYSAVSVERSGAERASVGIGYWPTGLAVHPSSDANLGVQRVAFVNPGPDGPRRGLPSA